MNIDEFRALPKAEKHRLVNASRAHHLYRCYDAAGVLLYIGSSSDVDRRIAQHRRADGRSLASRWLSVCMARHEIGVCHPSRTAALAAEKQAIHDEDPLFNMTWRNGRPGSRIRTDVAHYLIARGHRALAIETACTCWGETLAEGQNDEWCVAHAKATA